MFDRNEIRAKGLDANVCTPSYQSFTKFLNTPALDGSKVGKIIEYEAQQNVPFPLDEVEWGYQIMGTTEDGDLDVMLMALKLDVIDSLSTVCTDLGLKLSIVDGSSAALRNAFGLRIDVTIADSGLPRFEMKAQRWIRVSSDEGLTENLN